MIRTRKLIASLLLFTFAQAQAGDPQIPPRVVFDEARQVLWALEEGRLLRYDTRRRMLLGSLELPAFSHAAGRYACAPDMIADGAGGLLVSSNVEAALWRVEGGGRSVERIELRLDTDLDKELGFTGLVFAGHRLFAVSSLQGSLWEIDLAARAAKKLPLPRTLRGACSVGLKGTQAAAPAASAPAMRRTSSGAAEPEAPVLCIHGSRETFAVEVGPAGQARFREEGCR